LWRAGGRAASCRDDDLSRGLLPFDPGSLTAKALRQLGYRLAECEIGGGCEHVGRNPFGKRLIDDPVGAAGSVLLVQSRQLPWREAIGRPGQSGPESTVDERDLSVDQPQTHDVGRFVEGVERRVDVVTSGVPPPTALDRFTGDDLGSARQRPSSGFQEHPVLDERRHHIDRRHRHIVSYDPAMPADVLAATLLAPGQLELQRFPYPDKLERGAVLLKMLASGICGTDKHTFRG